MAKKDCIEKALSQDEMNKFRQLLIAKRMEIIGDVGSMELNSSCGDGGNSSHSPSHMADAGSDNYERENTLGLMESEIRILIEVDNALKRLDNETFGVCEGNGEFIPKARLKAIPWAKYCVSCANQMEKYNRVSNSSQKKYHYAPGIDDLDIDDYSNINMLNNEKD